MLIKNIKLEKYNWTIYFYHNDNIEEILDFIKTLNCNTGILKDIGNTLKENKINNALCYTSLSDKTSCIVINNTSSQEHYKGTLIHEINHICSHLEEYYNINPHSEEACYLIGDIAYKLL